MDPEVTESLDSSPLESPHLTLTPGQEFSHEAVFILTPATFAPTSNSLEDMQ